MFLVKGWSTYGFIIKGASINILLLLFINKKWQNLVANIPQNLKKGVVMRGWTVYIQLNQETCSCSSSEKPKKCNDICRKRDWQFSVVRWGIPCMLVLFCHLQRQSNATSCACLQWKLANLEEEEGERVIVLFHPNGRFRIAVRFKDQWWKGFTTT